MTADIGGTNARLQLWSRAAASGDVALVYRSTYRPASFASLVECVRRFLDDCARALSSNDADDAVAAAEVGVARTVLAVCGPTWCDGRKNESNNVPRWCQPGRAVSLHDAAEIEQSLGWAAGTLRFINDFEAVGYCVAAHLSGERAHPLTRPSPPPRVLHRPHEDSATVAVADTESAFAPAACVGAGTGLGACLVVPSADSSIRVLPSELGMLNSVCPASELEWRLLQFLRRVEGTAADPYVEIERIVSGPGLAAVLDFLVADEGAGAGGTATASPRSASAIAALAEVADDAERRPAVIAHLAESGDDLLCVRAVDLFLSFYGRVLGHAAIAFLPAAGLFIAGGILPRLAWRLPCLGGGRDGGDDPLLKSFLAQGPKMSGLVARTPLLLLDDPDAGVRGCLFVALELEAKASQ